MAIAFLAIHSNAQSNKLVLGVKAGTNYSNVYDEQGQDFNADAKFGLVAGGFLSIPIGAFIGVQPEVLFSQKGFKATGSLLGGNYSLTRTTNYIDVPLMLAIKPVPFVSILVGPQYLYLLRQKDVFEAGGVTVLQEQEFKNDNLRKNILCFIGGIDINVKHFVLGARAGWDIQNNNGDGTSSTPRYKNAWIQGTVGFRIYNPFLSPSFSSHSFPPLPFHPFFFFLFSLPPCLSAAIISSSPSCLSLILCFALFPFTLSLSLFPSLFLRISLPLSNILHPLPLPFSLHFIIQSSVLRKILIPDFIVQLIDNM